MVAMKAVNLQSYIPQRACLMGRPSKNGLEERMHLCTGKWVLNIGEDMHTDSARFETFNFTQPSKTRFYNDQPAARPEVRSAARPFDLSP